MTKQKTQTEFHQFFCIVCGHEGIPLPRPVGKQRETRHLKKLYCTSCHTDTNHCEISPRSYYQAEDFYSDFIRGYFNEYTRSN